jgi:hypothetical protein
MAEEIDQDDIQQASEVSIGDTFYHLETQDDVELPTTNRILVHECNQVVSVA